MQNILKKILKILAKAVLKRYKPEVIGVTGSVGKTSAKEAIACVLGSRFRVRQNRKNYNNEFGLPLTVLNVDSQGSFVLGWLVVFAKALRLIIKKDKNFPEIIILEMGIDHPGDMEYLVSIAKPQTGVVTTIGQSHLEYFGTVDTVAKEKGRLIQKLSGNGWAILNYDDLRVRKMAKSSKSKVITYGFDKKADIHALELNFSFEKRKNISSLAGITFKMRYDGSVVPVHLPNVVGYPAVYSALAAAATGVSHGMNLIEVSQALFNYVPPKGRLNLIDGIKSTMIIDDTYNASPQSTLEAIRVTGMISLDKSASRWAILGDMLELGSYTEEGHLLVGQAVAENKFDFLVAVGERATGIIEGAKLKKMKKEKIFHFSTSEEAKIFVQNQISKNDLLLVKGSQGMRMERIVKEVMAEPLKAVELLVRQDWADA